MNPRRSRLASKQAMRLLLMCAPIAAASSHELPDAQVRLRPLVVVDADARVMGLYVDGAALMTIGRTRYAVSLEYSGSSLFDLQYPSPNLYYQSKKCTGKAYVEYQLARPYQQLITHIEGDKVKAYPSEGVLEAFEAASVRAGDGSDCKNFHYSPALYLRLGDPINITSRFRPPFRIK